MVVVANLLCICSPQYVNNIAHTKTLLGPGHTGEKLLGIDSAILHCGGAQAVVTVTTALGKVRFTKVAQENTAAAGKAITISHDLLQLLMRAVVFLFIGFLGDDVLDLEAVTLIKEKYTLSRQTIAPGTARLLIIALQVARQVVVNAHAYIRLTNAHAKGNCRHQHRHIVANE